MIFRDAPSETLLFTIFSFFLCLKVLAGWPAWLGSPVATWWLLGALWSFLKPLGGLQRLPGGLLELLGASWGLLGGLLGVLEVDLKLNIILEGFNFAEGPS